MAEINYKPMEEFFKEELDLIKQEIEATDELYDELKEHFDRIKTSSSPGALGFITKQTPNLVSLKGNKISLIKDLVNAKKVIIETSIKTKPEDNQDNDNETLKAIHRMLLENKKEDYIKNINETTQVETEQFDDEYYDNLLEQKLAEIDENAETPEDEVKVTVKEENVIYAVDMEKNIYPLDLDYNILDDYPIPDFIIDFQEIDGEMKAFNQFGQELEIVSLEED